jgi:very-long-chain enoyl-CoA reductase
MRLNIPRQRIELLHGKEKILLKGDDSQLSKYNIEDGDNLLIKDLGPQISWKTLFKSISRSLKLSSRV